MTERAAAAADVIAEEIDDELCLLRIDTSEVLVLNRTASDVWLLASDGMQAQEVVATLATAYRRSAADIADEVHAVIADLRVRGFLVDAP